jgi:hypothetical protein
VEVDFGQHNGGVSRTRNICQPSKHKSDMNWHEIGLWFITAFVGAALVKLIDLAAARYLQRHSRVEKKVNRILEYLREYGELTELFRFSAFLSQEIVRDEDGELRKDATGKYIIESKILEPEPRFEQAIHSLKGADIGTTITQRIAAIRLMSSEVTDFALELDPSGDLDKQLTELYMKTVFSIEALLKHKESGDPNKEFNEMIKALSEASKTRRQIRSKLQSYLE